MSLEVFNACCKGYADRVFDQRVLGVEYGYWCGYYNNSKRPKNPSVLARKMTKERDAYSGFQSKQSAPEVDVEAFLEVERRFKSKLSKGSETYG